MAEQLVIGDRVWEFAQEAENNNGRIGQQGEVLDVSMKAWLPQALVKFVDAEEWIDWRFLLRLNAIDALGKLADDERLSSD